MKDLRLLPLLMIAAGALLCLRLVTLALGEPPQIGVTQALAQEAAQPADPAAEPAADDATGGDGTEAENALPEMAGAAPAIQESLAERRGELDARASDIDLREKLLAATQQRVEERIAELEAIEKRIDVMLNKRKEEEDARFAALVEMYGKMKPKDAARIMNGLDMVVLERVVSRINPRQMSEIMAAMDPRVAQKLTMELSAEPAELTVEASAAGELPKIVGTPNPE